MKKKKSLNITLAIFIGLVLGILFGLFMPGRYEFALPVVQLVSSLYMNALRMMIYPLVFCSLVMGIQGIGSVSATGKVGGQSVLYFVFLLSRESPALLKGRQAGAKEHGSGAARLKV